MESNKINKFVVLTTQRSGSNYFCFWLNNHPNIRCHSELFLNKYIGMDGFNYYCGSKFSRKILTLLFCNEGMKKLSFNSILSNLIGDFYQSLLYNPYHSGPITDDEGLELRGKYHIQAYPEHDRSVGFKLMYDQLKEYKMLENLIKIESCKIIHLIRKNVLKNYLSRLTKRKRGIAHSAEKVDKIKIHVNPLNLLKHIEKTIKLTNAMRNKFNKHSYLEVSYEEFIEDYGLMSEKVYDFLEVDNIDVRRPVLKKLNPDSSRDMIKNYEEISDILKNTPYMNLLD